MRPYGLRKHDELEYSALGPPSRVRNIHSITRTKARRLLHKQGRNDNKKELTMADETTKSDGPPAQNSGGNCPYCGQHFDGDLTAHLGTCGSGPYEHKSELGNLVGEVPPKEDDGGFSY
jgi:hypothetical protein